MSSYRDKAGSMPQTSSSSTPLAAVRPVRARGRQIQTPGGNEVGGGGLNLCFLRVVPLGRSDTRWASCHVASSQPCLG